MTLVKICGLRESAPALAAARAGADLLGMVFAPSKRQISPKKARTIALVVKGEERYSFELDRNLPKVAGDSSARLEAFCGIVEECLREARPMLVGVFVNEAAERVNEIANLCQLDFVQLSGDETWEYCRAIQRPVIKAFRIGAQSSREIRDYVNKGLRLLDGRGFSCLLESYIPGSYGGTGQTFDWGLAQDLAAEFPFILAGGLTTDNVVHALERVRPWGLDVSSGVETGGAKDIAKIIAFIDTVKGYDGRE